MKILFAKLISGALIAGLLIGCAPAVQSTSVPVTSAPAEPTAKPAPVHIKVSVLPFLSYTPLFIAQEEGYFAAQNLEVEFVSLTSGAQLPAELASGQIDVGVGFISVGLLSAMSQGANIQIVADKGYLDPQGCTSGALLARKDLITNGELNLTAEAIKNSKSFYSKTTLSEYFFDKSIASLGVSSSDVKDSVISFNDLAEAFKTGNMDISNTSEPWVTRVLKAGNTVVWKDYKTAFPNDQFSVIIYGPTLLTNTDAGNRFMTAYLQGVRQYQKGTTDRNVEIANKYTKIEPAELKTLCWQTMHEDGMINTQTIVDFQDWAVKKGYLKNAVPADKFWNPSFAEFAQNALK